jgi:hypothetical protein
VLIKYRSESIKEAPASINASVASKNEASASINDPSMWITGRGRGETDPVWSVEEASRAFREGAAAEELRSAR